MSDKAEASGYRQAKAIDRLRMSVTGGPAKVTSFAKWRSQAKSIVTGSRGRISKTAKKITRSQTAASGAGKGRKINTRRGKTRRV